MYPHTCQCGSPAYIGARVVECSNKKCQHYKAIKVALTDSGLGGVVLGLTNADPIVIYCIDCKAVAAATTATGHAARRHLLLYL
jgi:hypothetical protein